MLKPLVKLGFCELVISDRETLKKRKKNAFFISDRETLQNFDILWPGRTFSANNFFCLDPLLGTTSKFQKKRILDLLQNI